MRPPRAADEARSWSLLATFALGSALATSAGGDDDDDDDGQGNAGRAGVSAAAGAGGGGTGAGGAGGAGGLNPDHPCAAPIGRLRPNETALSVNNNIHFNDLTEAGPQGPTVKKRLEFRQDAEFESFAGSCAIAFCTWSVSLRNSKSEDVVPPPTDSCFAPPVGPSP